MKQYLIILLFPFVGCTCGKTIEDGSRSIPIINNGTRPISYYMTNRYAGNQYPDTALENSVVLTDLPPGRSTTLYIGNPEWLYKYPTVTERICLFTFDTDTLKKYSWEVIRSQYKVLKRYDLSLDDFIRMDYKIELP
jgi:hypothetical protein